MTLIKLRLYFLFTDLSQHFGIYLVSLHSGFLFMRVGKRWYKVICVMKLKVIQTQPDNQNIKPEIFQIYGRNYSETLIETKKKNANFKWLLCQITGTINRVIFLVLIFSSSTMTLPESYSGRQTFKSFWWMCCWMCTFLHSGRRVYLFSWGDSNIKTSGTIANSQTDRGRQLKFKKKVLLPK